MAIFFLPLPDGEKQETGLSEHQLIIVKTDLPYPISCQTKFSADYRMQCLPLDCSFKQNTLISIGKYYTNSNL